MAEVLAVGGLTVHLTAHPESSSILDDITFSVAAGEVLGIVGESGSGKSMLALSVMGLLPPALTIQAGRIAVLGDELAQQRQPQTEQFTKEFAFDAVNTLMLCRCYESK